MIKASPTETAIDFTAHKHPVRAVPCNDCGQPIGSKCLRPSGHEASDFHKARKELADTMFIELHGKDASIDRIDGKWLINPQDR